MTFTDTLGAIVAKQNSLLCVGLDPDVTKMPAQFVTDPTPLYSFCKEIIDATADLVCAYKPNSAFFEASGAEGVAQLKQVCTYIREKAPDVIIILDYKRGDIGNTNNYYTEFAFNYVGVDAVTIQPYLGQEAVQSYLDYADKGVIVLCRTSNAGSGEFQDLEVNGRKLYLYVAEQVATQWNTNKNCMLVVGATYPAEMAEVRQLVGDDMWFLVPGLGAQGGNVAATVKAGINAAGAGMIINSSRDILYQSNEFDFADKARQRATETRDEINKYRS